MIFCNGVNIRARVRVQLLRSPHLNPLPEGEEMIQVQTGKMVYSTNRAHGLQWIGKEERADAVGGNQCYGSTSRVYR
jgi:hypothetical protein